MGELEVFVGAVFRQLAVSQRLSGFFLKFLLRRLAGFFTAGVLFIVALAAAQVFLQVGFAGAQSAEQVTFFGLIDHHIRHHSLGLDRFAGRRVITRRGDLQTRVWAQWPHGLHRAFAKGLVAHDGATLVVLQSAGDDLAGRGRTFVHQHHQGHVFQHAFGGVGHAFDRVRAAPALVKLGRGFVDELAFCQLPVGRDHRHVFRQERRRNGHRRVEQTAWVVAQIKHHAFEVGLGFVDFFGFFGEIIHRALLELRQANPGVTRLDDPATHRLRADLLAGDHHIEGAVLFFAENRQTDLGVGLAAHAFDRFIESQTLDHGVVDLGDQIIRLEPGLERR